ncbi:hypothetical protein MIDIC_110125 [Alphaproteobacteria bacterium]
MIVIPLPWYSAITASCLSTSSNTMDKVTNQSWLRYKGLCGDN